MKVGILREPSYDRRVSLLPEHIEQLLKWNMQVLVESGAGVNAFAGDEQYKEAGASIVQRDEALSQSDILLSIQSPTSEMLSKSSGKIWIGVYGPLWNKDLVDLFCRQGHTMYSMDMIPRTTRAQSMDVLSSQANIAGYKAVLLAASMYSRYMPMFMTAAGSIRPAKVLVLGAGVAGLQAIATAKRLGAVVEVFDTRPAVKEEVMSLGAKFVEVEGAADAAQAGGYAVEQSEDFKKRQQEKIAEHVAKSDIVITTAQIPGKKAPLLISNAMLQSMRKGSIIIDLAASTGGNTEVTKNNETVDYNGVTVVGNSLLASTMPSDASKLYGKNVLNFMQLSIKDGHWNHAQEDELIQGTCTVLNGKIVHEKLLQ